MKKKKKSLNAGFVNVTSDYRLLLKIIQTLGLFNSKHNPAFRVCCFSTLYPTAYFSTAHHFIHKYKLLLCACALRTCWLDRHWVLDNHNKVDVWEAVLLESFKHPENNLLLVLFVLSCKNRSTFGIDLFIFVSFQSHIELILKCLF